MIATADLAAEVAGAAERLRPHVRHTYLEPSPWLGRESGAEVYLKLENLQHTGSFKVRGAMNKLLCLGEAERRRGVVAASTGNHGAAVAFSLARLGAPGLIFVPESASASKVRMIERLGGEIRRVEGDPVNAERAARRYAAENGLTYLSPYNDLEVVAGQGSVGVELAAAERRIDAVVVAVGGGGLVGGIAAYLKDRDPAVRIVGASPESSPVMIRSVEAGRILDLPSLPTLSDGTAGGLEEGAVTFELCRTLVDDFVTVSEEEIAAALRGFLDAHHQLIEGAAAVAIASFLKLRERFAGQTVGVVLCGGNIGLETLRSVL